MQQAEGFETALRSYVENCVETVDSCFLGDSVDEGVARIEDFLDQVDAQPLPDGVGARADHRQRLLRHRLPALHHATSGSCSARRSRQGFDGDGAALLRLADLYAAPAVRAAATANNLIEALSTINCLDDPGAITPAQVPAAVDDFEQASPTFGDAFAWGLLGCSGFDARASEKPPTVRAEGAAPIVVIGTTRDPATPLAWCREPGRPARVRAC